MLQTAGFTHKTSADTGTAQLGITTVLVRSLHKINNGYATVKHTWLAVRVVRRPEVVTLSQTGARLLECFGHVPCRYQICERDHEQILKASWALQY